MLGSAPRNKTDRPFLHINLGNILTMISIIITITIFHGKVMSRISIMETKMDIMYLWFEKQIIEHRYVPVNFGADFKTLKEEKSKNDLRPGPHSGIPTN